MYCADFVMVICYNVAGDKIMINLLRFLNISVINSNIPSGIKNKIIIVIIAITIILILGYFIKNNMEGNK